MALDLATEEAQSLTSARPSFAFEDGYLGVSTHNEEMLIRAWPHPHAITRFGAHGWDRFWPRLRLLHPGQKEARHAPVDGMGGNERLQEKWAAYHALRLTIPPDVAESVQGFPNHQWALLELIHECPSFLDLVRSNPALAFAMANNQEFRTLTARTPATQAKWHVNKTQRALLEWLGFPGTKSVVKIFQKIQTDGLTPWDLRLLRSALNSDGPARKLLSHQDRINAGVLRLVVISALSHAITPRLIREVAASADEDVYPHTADLLSDAASCIHEIDGRSRLPRFNSREDVRAYRRQVAVRADFLRANRKALEKYGPWYPPPPIPGTKHIRPITFRHELLREARKQKNCVLSHQGGVMNERSYIYRVLRPERATLEIVRHADKSWGIRELQRSCNRDVSPATRRAVEQWLATYRLGL